MKHAFSFVFFSFTRQEEKKVDETTMGKTMEKGFRIKHEIVLRDALLVLLYHFVRPIHLYIFLCMLNESRSNNKFINNSISVSHWIYFW